MRSIFVVLMLIVLAGTVSACNTVDGLGRDMRAGGNALSDAAN